MPIELRLRDPVLVGERHPNRQRQVFAGNGVFVVDVNYRGNTVEGPYSPAWAGVRCMMGEVFLKGINLPGALEGGKQ